MKSILCLSFIRHVFSQIQPLKLSYWRFKIFQTSASDVLASLLTVDCDACNSGNAEENVVVIFDQTSSRLLKQFLNIVYTGQLLINCIS